MVGMVLLVLSVVGAGAKVLLVGEDAAPPPQNHRASRARRRLD